MSEPKPRVTGHAKCEYGHCTGRKVADYCETCDYKQLNEGSKRQREAWDEERRRLQRDITAHALAIKYLILYYSEMVREPRKP